MKKFIAILLALSLFVAQTQAISLRKVGLNGHLHPKFRRLSAMGSHRLSLSVEGKGMFVYRIRSKDGDTTSGDADESMDLAGDGSTVGDVGVASGYDNAYSGGVDSAVTTGQADGEPGNRDVVATDTDGDDRNDLIFSHDGNVHVNRYGFLVDDNGFLLFGAGKSPDGSGKGEDSIHIPSRADSVVVASDGTVLAEENGGAVFSDCGQIKLARFANEAGLNIYDKIKSRCASANRVGFALGNWCAGGELDGKIHTYYSKSDLSGAMIEGAPRDLGFGKIVTN